VVEPIVSPEAGRVLVVDDESAIQRAYARLLGRAGLKVAVTGDAGEALKLVKAGAIDLVISDIHMPGISGVDLLKQVYAHDPELPVILMSGVPHVETAAEAIEHGVYRYLLKPIDPRKLLDSVHLGLARPRSGRVRQPVDVDRALASLWMAYQPIV
jgi:DNA-binding NtrC family response regulator